MTWICLIDEAVHIYTQETDRSFEFAKFAAINISISLMHLVKTHIILSTRDKYRYSFDDAQH